MPVPSVAAPAPGNAPANMSLAASHGARPGALGRAGTHLLVPGLLAAGLAAWDPARNGGPPTCPWAMLTGHACPGCGLTRAVGALLRGRLHEALAWHPLAPVLVAQLAAACIAYVVLGPLRRRVPTWVPPALLVANIVLLVGVWGVRGLTGDLAGLA